MGDPFHGQLTAVKTRHPLTVSHDRIAGSSVEPAEVAYFLKFTADQVIDFKGSQAQVFSQIIRTSQKNRSSPKSYYGIYLRVKQKRNIIKKKFPQ